MRNENTEIELFSSFYYISASIQQRFHKISMNKMYSVFNDKSDSIQAEALDRFSAMEKQERGAIRKNYFLDLDQQEFKEPNSSYIDTKCRTGKEQYFCLLVSHF